MSVVISLLPAIAGGYWFLSRSNLARFRFARLSGYHLVYASAFAGLIFYGVAHLLLLPVRIYFPGAVDVWDRHSPELLTATAQVSLLLAHVLYLLSNLCFSESTQAQAAAAASGSLIELTLEEALEGHCLVEVSLRSRKVYVGLPLSSGVGKLPDSDISLVPVYSGYRREASMELLLTRDYRPVVTALVDAYSPSDLGLKDFRVVFSLSEVVSVRPFEDEVFDAFRDDQDGDMDTWLF